jgi:CTP synthase
VVDAKLNPDKEVTIAMVGKYMELLDAYKSLIEAICMPAFRPAPRSTSSTSMPRRGSARHRNAGRPDAILVPGGFGDPWRGRQDCTVQLCPREQGPYLGICLGMQVAVIEYARNVVGLTDAHSTEFKQECKHPVIALITEWTSERQSENPRCQFRSRRHHALGRQECRLEKDSWAQCLLWQGVIVERHRHRYEVNNTYLPTAAGRRPCAFPAAAWTA